jgi:hypothetical protein
VLEALILTAGVVASLTAYAFWAAKKGKEFGYLGPFLFSGLTILVLTSFIQVMTMIKINSERTSKKHWHVINPLLVITSVVKHRIADFHSIGTYISCFVWRTRSLGFLRLHSL